MITHISKEVSSVASKIYSNFKSKKLYAGYDYLNENQIRDTLNVYIFLLSKNEIGHFSYKDQENAARISKKISSLTGYDAVKIYFVLYELQLLAESGNAVAQKILRYDIAKKNGSSIFLPPKPTDFLTDVKSILLYLIILFLLIYFAPVILSTIKGFVKKYED